MKRSALALLAAGTAAFAPVPALAADQGRVIRTDQSKPRAPEGQAVPASLAADIDHWLWQRSGGWLFNRYDKGSVRDVTLREGVVNSPKWIVRAHYTYNQGKPGWVDIWLEGGTVRCFYFWDKSDRCQ